MSSITTQLVLTRLSELALNGVAISMATAVIVAGRGTPQSLAGAFAVYALIKRTANKAGSDSASSLDHFLEDQYDFNVDEFIFDNIEAIDKKLGGYGEKITDYLEQWKEEIYENAKEFEISKQEAESKCTDCNSQCIIYLIKKDKEKKNADDTIKCHFGLFYDNINIIAKTK